MNLKMGLRKMKIPPIAMSIAAVLLTVGCTGKNPELSKLPNIELIQDMMDSPALKAQDHENADELKASSRLPPDGTVPVGFTPYKYAGDAAEAAAKLKNPYAGNSKAELLELGRRKFETYCAVCHGYSGGGDGPVAPKMALKPPPLVSDKIKDVTDGAIFHIITDGQGVMSSYAYQLVNENDRWAIVNYVRSLQKLSGQKAAPEKPAAKSAAKPAK